MIRLYDTNSNSRSIAPSLDLPGLLNLAVDVGMSRIELLDLPLKPLKLDTSVLVVDLQRVLAHNTRLLLQLLELLRLLLSIRL